MPRSICLATIGLQDTAEGRGIDSYCVETARLLSRKKWNVTVLTDRTLAAEYYERNGIPIHYTNHLVEPSERAEITSEYSMSLSQMRSRLFHAALLTLMNESKRQFDLIEFSDRGGAGFIPIQMKKSSRAYENSRIIVKVHGPSQWFVERARIEWTTWENLINDYTERYSFENADVQVSLSSHLLDRCRQHGWKVRSDATVCPLPFSLAVRSKNRIQDLVDAAYQQAQTFSNPRKIVQWYEECVGSRGQKQPKARRKSSPCVTVIIPTKNASKYLHTALQSLTTQTYKITKVIIKDSSTKLEEVLRTRHLAKRHGAWMIHRNDTGLANAMNQALGYVDTKYLMQFDADNIAMPHMIDTFVRGIECRNDVAVLSSYHARFCDEDEPRLLNSVSNDRGATFIPRSYYRPVGPCLPNLFLHNVQGDATSIYLTKTLKQIGGWPEDNRGHADWLLWLRLLETGHQMDVIPEVLYYYRLRPDSLSRVDRRRERDQAAISIIQGIIRNRSEVFSRSYSSIHRLLRRIDSLEQELRLRESELNAIRHSLSYRFMRLCASRIDPLLPTGTRRGQIREMITAYVRYMTGHNGG